MTLPPKRYVIPLEGNFKSSDFYCRTDLAGYVGKCLVCEDEYSHLREHFEKYHSTPETRAKPRFVRIVTSLTVPPATIHPDNGFCGLCESEDGKPVPIEHLKAHFVEEHLQGKWQCPLCNHKCSPKAQLAHFQSHSGDVKCLVEGCISRPESYAAAKFHLRRCHPAIPTKDRHLYIEDLTEEEYKDILVKKDRANGILDKKKVKGNVSIVRGVRDKLEVYHNKRLSEDPALTKKIDILFQKFLSYFNVPEDNDIVVVKNSAFITLWKVSWMTPLLVFQRVPKTTGMKQLQANTFHPDQQVGRPNQPNNFSFLHSGYAKGHMAPGADFRELEDFIQSHFYTNICAMRRYFNWIVRPKLEHYLRQKANSQEDPLYTAHFPIMQGGQPTTLNGVRVADSFGCVMITEESQGHSIIGWELENNDKWQSFKNKTVDPFILFGKTTIPFRKTREDFLTIHSTTPEIDLTPPPSTATTLSSSTTVSSSSCLSSSSGTATPTSIRSSPISKDVAKWDEDKAPDTDIEMVKSDLTQPLQNVTMKEEEKEPEVGGKDKLLKRAPPPSPSHTQCKKKKTYDTPKLPSSATSRISLGPNPSLNSLMDLDPEAEDFKVPMRQSVIDSYLNVFRIKNPSHHQLKNK